MCDSQDKPLENVNKKRESRWAWRGLVKYAGSEILYSESQNACRVIGPFNSKYDTEFEVPGPSEAIRRHRTKSGAGVHIPSDILKNCYQEQNNFNLPISCDTIIYFYMPQ